MFKPRFFPISLLISALLLLSGRTASGQQQWSPRTNWQARDVSILDSHLTSLQAKLGDFNVSWNADFKQLTVANADGASLWETEAGKVFIMAGKGQDQVTEWQGSFTVHDRATNMKCREQTLDSFLSDRGAIALRGRLLGPHCDLTYSLKFELSAAKRLHFEITILDKDGIGIPQDINRTFLTYRSTPGEKFFGFGEQYSYLDMKGRIVPILTTEQGHMRGLQPYSFLLNQFSRGAAGHWYSTYAAVPFYFTNTNRSLFLETSEYSSFDLSNPGRVEIVVWKKGLGGQILSGESPLNLLSTYTEYAGRMAVPPRWFHHGAIVGLMGGSDKVRYIWAKLKEQGTPIAGFWLQDWVGKRATPLATRLWWNWELDTESYPDWKDLVATLDAEGIATLGYVNPFLSDASTKLLHNHNYFQEGKDRDFLVKKPDGTPYEIDSEGFTGTLVDLTNPEAFIWYKDIIKSQLIGNGMKGWMADFGEALPFDAILKNGDPRVVHNLYPTLWAKVNREAIAEAGMEGEAVAFLRSGYTRSPGNAQVFWLGDQMTSWDEYDGMKSAIAGLLSGGLSGFTINHADMGGYISMYKKVAGYPLLNFYRTREMLLRGIEMATFTSVFRNHEGNDPASNYQFYSDNQTIEFYSRFAKIFTLLTDYREKLFDEAHTKGYPVARHLLLGYPEDATAWTIKDQWLLGSEFLIAPVVDPGVTTRRVYLPKGNWVHLWSQAVYSSPGGQWITISAPLGSPPVFFVQGSLVGEKFCKDVEALLRSLKNQGLSKQ